MAQPSKISSPHQHDVCVPVEQTHPIALLSGLKQSNNPLTPLNNWSNKEVITTKRKANISDKEEFHRVPISTGADNYCGPVVIQDQRLESEDQHDSRQITLTQVERDFPSTDSKLLSGKSAGIEAWIAEVGPDETGCQRALKAKRKLDIGNEGDSFSARKRSKVFAPSSAPLTKKALHQIDTTHSDKSSEYSSTGSMASHATSSQPTKDAEGNITPYHPNYKNFLNERDIWDAKDDQLPNNMSELLEVMGASRESPGPSLTKHKEYIRNMQNSSNEAVANFLQYTYFVKAAWIEDGCSTVQQDHAWNRFVPLYPEKLPRLASPKPDMAYAWEADATKSVFALQKLTKSILKQKKLDQGSSEGKAKSDSAQTKSDKPTYEVRSWAAPNGLPAFTWPVFTVEGKGDAGKLKIAHLQNMNNGSVMVNNILELKRRVGSDGDFYDRAMILTLDATPESLQLHCHWVSRVADGRVKFFMGELADWRPRNKKADQFLEAYRSITNAVEYTRKLALEELKRDCQALVDRQGEIQVPELLTPTGQSVPAAEPERSSSEESEHAGLSNKRARV